MDLHLLINPLRLGDVLRQHKTLELNLKILEYGLDLGQVVGASVELISAKP